VRMQFQGARAQLRRAFRSPFSPQSSKPTIVHFSHHKCGTVWMQSILSKVASRYGMRSQIYRRHSQFNPTAEIVVNDSSVHIDGLSNFRGSHMIRDPRDVAVSAYHYHLWTKEAWARVPRERFGGKSFHDHLNSLNPADGLAAQIKQLRSQLLGTPKKGSHLRSGRPGQWREELTAQHIELFKMDGSRLLIKLGYESDNNWS